MNHTHAYASYLERTCRHSFVYTERRTDSQLSLIATPHGGASHTAETGGWDNAILKTMEEIHANIV